MAKHRIEGSDEWLRQCRTLRGNMPVVTRDVTTDMARFVVSRATTRIPVVLGRARNSVRIVHTSATTARIEAGGRAVPYYGWLDFGGVNGVGLRRPYLRSGRYLWRVLKDNPKKFEELGEKTLLKEVRKAGFKTK